MAVDVRQVQKNISYRDNLIVGDRTQILTLKEELDYLYTLIRNIKGSVAFDTPASVTLNELETRLVSLLDNNILDNVYLTNATSETQPTSDNSTKLATTAFVQNIKQEIQNSTGDDKHFSFNFTLANIQTYNYESKDYHALVVNHNMNKNPTVTLTQGVGVGTNLKEIKPQVIYETTDRAVIFLGEITRLPQVTLGTVFMN